VARPPDPASLERPWIAAYPPGVPPTYRLPEVALPRLLDDAARDFPERLALVTDDGSVDHETLRDRVAQVTTVLADLGVGSGDRVVVAVQNTATAPALLFACWRLGAVVVPVSPELRADRLVAIVRDAEAAAVLGTPAVVHALAQQQALPAVVVSVTGDEWPRRRRFGRQPGSRRGAGRGARRASREGAIALAELLAGDGVRTAPPAPMPDAPALLAYRPRSRELRGVVLTHANLVANAFQARLWVPDIQAGRERVLVADPLHEPLPLTVGLLAAILSAATVVLLDRPDAATLARAIERERPTLLAGLPPRLADLLLDGEPAKRDLRSLRVCLAGGAPLDPRVAAGVEGRTGGARVREVYGLAEAGALTHAQPVYGRSVPTTMGLPVTGTVAVVVDPDDLGAILPPNEAGMLLVSGPQVATGYWHRDAETAATFRDGWVVTGDLVRVDEAGVFEHIGRADEVVTRQGQLVSPRRVEAALERHPSVRRAGVVASGDLLLAAVVTSRRSRPDSDALLAHCRALLHPAAVPDHVTLVDELPETDAGDLARDELRRELAGR
jgi:long-chain acyl-CoA synthetase